MRDSVAQIRPRVLYRTGAEIAHPATNIGPTADGYLFSLRTPRLVDLGKAAAARWTFNTWVTHD